VRIVRSTACAGASGCAIGLWTATDPGSWVPLVPLALAAAAIALLLGGSTPAAFLAATVALSGVGGRNFGYAGTGLTEIDELLIPLIPIVLGFLWWALRFGNPPPSSQAVQAQLRLHWPLWGLALYATTTALWAERPAVAFAVGLCWIAVLAYLAVNELRPAELTYALAAGLWVLLAASNIRQWLAPVSRPFGGSDAENLLPFGRLVGITEDSMEAGELGVVCLVASLLLRRRAERWFGTLLGLFSVLHSDQRASMAAVAAALLVVAVLRARTPGARLLLICGTAVLVLTPVAVGLLDAGTIARASDGRDLQTLSQRTVQWSEAWESFDEWLMLGNGPGAEETVARGTFAPVTTNLHNRALQATVALGLPGLAFGAIGLGRALKRWGRLPPEIVGLLIGVVVNSVTVPGFGSVGLTPTAMSLLLVVYAASRAGPADSHEPDQRSASSLSATST